MIASCRLGILSVFSHNHCFLSYDALLADGKEEFYGRGRNCRICQARKPSIDARHIGAVADKCAVKVETVSRTPYLRFRIYLRFQAGMMANAKDKDRVKFARFKESK